MATTYKKISEQIRTLMGNGIVSDDFRFSLRYIAELVAQEVAFEARKDAFESSNAGETTFANDAFIIIVKKLINNFLLCLFSKRVKL
jgi:hypothetical protein